MKNLKKQIPKAINEKMKDIIESDAIPVKWEDVKANISLRLENWEWNRDVLREIPNKKYLNLALYCVLDLIKIGEGTISVSVKNNMLQYWNIDEKELWEVAETNFQREHFFIRHIDEITGVTKLYLSKTRVLSFEEDETYVLTNEYHRDGAVGMLRFDLLEKFTEQKKCNIYILPSSVDEVILIPDRGDRNPEFLKFLVKKNNTDYPDEGDLSENVYYFREGQKAVEIVI